MRRAWTIGRALGLAVLEATSYAAVLAGAAVMSTFAAAGIGIVVILAALPGLLPFWLVLFPITVPLSLAAGMLAAAPTTLLVLPLTAIVTRTRPVFQQVALPVAGGLSGLVCALVADAASPRAPGEASVLVAAVCVLAGLGGGLCFGRALDA